MEVVIDAEVRMALRHTVQPVVGYDIEAVQGGDAALSDSIGGREVQQSTLSSHPAGGGSIEALEDADVFAEDSHALEKEPEGIPVQVVEGGLIC